MFNTGRVILHINVGEGMRATLIAHQQRIALRMIARVGRTLHNVNLPAVAVLRFTSRDTFAHNPRTGVLADVNHFSAGIGLLIVIGNGYGIKFTHRIIALQNTGRIFPRDSRSCFNLRPRNFRMVARTQTALGYKVVNTPFTIFIARVPVLHGRVFDLRTLHGIKFYHGCMQLVFIAHRRCATFQVTYIRAFIGYNQCSFKLTGVGCINAEVSRKFHRATHTLGDVTE